jgi:transposase
MSMEAISLPDDLSISHEIILQQHEQLVSSQRKIEQLEHRLDLLLRRIYGPRSERLFDPNQLALFEVLGQDLPAAVVSSAPVEAEPAEKSASKAKGHGRRQFPKNLERRRIVLDIPEAERTCPCGQPRRVIGEVVTERLGFDPARFYVNHYVQLKYACPCEQSGVKTAEKPIQPIEKGNAEPELVAFTAVSRFDDHSPYYRQENG